VILFVKIPGYSGWARSLIECLEAMFSDFEKKCGTKVVRIGGGSIEELHSSLACLDPKDFKAVWCCHDAETKPVHDFRLRVAQAKGVSVAHNHNLIKNPYEPFFVYEKIVGYNPHASLTHLFVNAPYITASAEISTVLNPVPVNAPTPEYLKGFGSRSFDALFGARFAEDKNRFLAVKFIESALSQDPELRIGFAFPPLAKWHRDRPDVEDYDYHRCMQAVEYLTDLGVAVFPDCEESAFLELLARSKTYFSFGMQDTLSVSAIQAAMLGCHPLYPDMLPYNTFLPKEYLYPAFDFSALFDKISEYKSDQKEAPEEKIDTAFYRPSAFIERSTQFLWQTIAPLM
jgi:hypothetical protein